jgi:diphosphomevalonate decarboxylase
MLRFPGKAFVLNKREAVKKVLGRDVLREPQRAQGKAYAPANIALCKYWGKRDPELNLPMTGSLSISLGSHGAHTKIQMADEADSLVLNGHLVASDSPIHTRLFAWLDLFRLEPHWFFEVESTSTVPVGAGLASSASGFAAATLAMDQLFDWGLNARKLSILARMGSGSASRSIQPGFMEWHVGSSENGMDSYAEPVSSEWRDLRIGLVKISEARKPIGSTEAMNRTVAESILYQSWPNKVDEDLPRIRRAVQEGDFIRLGETAESNALSMHATMWGCKPSVHFLLPESHAVLQTIRQLRTDGLAVYATMDAGPNVKILLCKSDIPAIQDAFPNTEIVNPFN